MNYRPLQMTSARLEEKFRQLVAQLYSEEVVAHRRHRFVKVYGPRFREARVQLLGV